MTNAACPRNGGLRPQVEIKVEEETEDLQIADGKARGQDGEVEGWLPHGTGLETHAYRLRATGPVHQLAKLVKHDLGLGIVLSLKVLKLLCKDFLTKRPDRLYSVAAILTERRQPADD
jgi:hypothetical protein